MNNKRIITLVTDWNNKSYYIGAVKGELLKRCPDSTIVDITHNISPFNLSQAAYVIKNSYTSFPDNSVHFIGICTEFSDETPYLLVNENNHWFIGADNGIFSLMFETIPEKIIKLNIAENQLFSSFPELEIFPGIISKLIYGQAHDILGEEVHELYSKFNLNPIYEGNTLNGNVIFIDSYNNVITNITFELFNNLRNGRRFDIYIQNQNYRISKISKRYNEVDKGELVAIFNSSGNLEIAMNYSSVAELLNLDNKSKIMIKFYDSQNS